MKDDVPVMMAPMAGITDRAFRTIVKEHGADLAFTQMVSARGLLENNRQSFKILDLEGEKQPRAVQLFGSCPQIMGEAVALVEAKYSPTNINLNAGCPTPKVVKVGMGAALMRNPQLLGKIVASMARQVKCQLSVKIRSGWSDKEINALEVARRCQEAGAHMLIVHGRTREQFYQGRARWSIIAAVREELEIPVIGNGDIFAPHDGVRMLKETDCQGIMLARGARGNPWLFTGIKRVLKGEEPVFPSLQERFEVIFRHLELAFKFSEEHVAIKEMRKHLSWYIKGLPDARRARDHIMKIEDSQELVEYLQGYADEF